MPDTTDQSPPRLEQQVADLRAELERYRAAAQDALEQLDWCIGYFTARNLPGLAGRLSANRRYIRSHLLARAEEPLPVSDAPATGGAG